MADDSFTAGESKPSSLGKYIILGVIGCAIMLGGNVIGLSYAIRLGITAVVLIVGILLVKASTPSEDTKF
jgi:FtsH-binding integral membrane protein